MKQQDSSKIAISKHFHKKAKKKFIRFGLEKFEKYILRGSLHILKKNLKIIFYLKSMIIHIGILRT